MVADIPPREKPRGQWLRSTQICTMRLAMVTHLQRNARRARTLPHARFEVSNCGGPDEVNFYQFELENKCKTNAPLLTSRERSPTYLERTLPNAPLLTLTAVENAN